jgi:hypothetical protein
LVRSRAPACPTARIRASGLLPPEHAREFLPPPPLPHLRRWCVRAPRRPRCTRARVCQAAACTHASLPPPPFFFFVPSPFLSGRAPLLVRACARSRRHRFPRARARLAAARPRAPPCLFFAPPPSHKQPHPSLFGSCVRAFPLQPSFLLANGREPFGLHLWMRAPPGLRAAHRCGLTCAYSPNCWLPCLYCTGGLPCKVVAAARATAPSSLGQTTGEWWWLGVCGQRYAVLDGGTCWTGCSIFGIGIRTGTSVNGRLPFTDHSPFASFPSSGTCKRGLLARAQSAAGAITV